ncbi:MAG: hypothetical protein IJA34_00265 [Lachnospiraceae bacterium]|nr:hypothetical protein [Lachnospiraceae bacterium]
MKEITKREILFSVIIVCVFLVFGLFIHGAISDSLMEEHSEYLKAVQIQSDTTLFQHGMKTNLGNAFVYGDLKAVDTVSYDEISGEYSYIKKIKEEYTEHTRTVYIYDEKGNIIGSTEEVYWTWDEVDSWSKHCQKISFLGVEFDYGTIEFPATSYIDTIKVSSDIRYVYKGSPAQCEGTLFANLGDNTISDVDFYNRQTIDETIESLTSNIELIIFWIFWIFLIIGLVVAFYYFDNRWLEDKLHKR